MKKSYYSYAVFLISFVWMFGRTLTQTIYGNSEWGDFVARIFGAIFLSSILALIFYFIYKSHITKNKLESIDSSYRPSRLYYSVASVLVSVSLLFSIYISYSDVSEKKQVAEAAAKAAAIQKDKFAIRAEAERQRVAALTPEQREAEAVAKANQAKAAAEAAAKVAKEQAALKEKEAADKAKHDFQMNLAGMGAKQLKLGMKDPDSFELKSLLFMPNGAACYEYRATNSFGAHLAGSAVLTSKGKFLVHEQNGNAFVSAWNKECTVSGGEEIADLVKRVILN